MFGGCSTSFTHNFAWKWKLFYQWRRTVRQEIAECSGNITQSSYYLWQTCLPNLLHEFHQILERGFPQMESYFSFSTLTIILPACYSVRDAIPGPWKYVPGALSLSWELGDTCGVCRGDNPSVQNYILLPQNKQRKYCIWSYHCDVTSVKYNAFSL